MSYNIIATDNEPYIATDEQEGEQVDVGDEPVMLREDTQQPALNAAATTRPTATVIISLCIAVALHAAVVSVMLARAL